MRRAKGGSARRLRMGSTEGCAAQHRSFYIRRHSFSCQTKGPTLPTIEGRALKSSSATVPGSSPANPPPSASPSCCADSLSTVGGLSGHPHAWTSAASDGAAGSCSHWGCWRHTPRGCWSDPCRCRIPALWQPWAVPWAGCIWRLRAYGGCKDSRPGEWGGHSHSAISWL